MLLFPITGITLWDKEQLQQSIRSHAQINTDFNVTASDSIEEKSHLLNIDGSLKLSLLSGLVNVRGAAKYLNDTKKSFKQQRLTLHYNSTTMFEELTMNHLASGNIAHYEAFDNDAATHVVTAVLYGANACFVFDREVSSDEDKTNIDGEVKAAFDKLKGISLGAEVDLNMNDNQKTAVQKFSCTFYGDFQLPSNPTSFEDALKIFADLPQLLGEKKELAVPLRVWLYPLDKLHKSAAKVQKDISTGLIKAVESVFESLGTTEMKCVDLLKDPPALAFAAFRDQIMQMKENCCSYKLSLMKKLGYLLPEIRGDKKKETELNDLLRDHMESPFRGLEQWVKEKEKESAIIKTLIRQLNDCGAKVEVNLDEILMDLEVENLVSYTFTSFEGPDVLLSAQKDYLSPKGQKEKNAPSAKWMSGLSSDAKKNMRTNMIVFKNLINSKQRKPAKFIVASKEVKHSPGSCILLYENGSDEDICFTPPSKPACPVIEQIKGHDVVFKVPQTCLAEELRLMYKMKDVEDWKSQHLQRSNTVTLTDLSPDTEYEIKYTAVGKLNYAIDSDVIHIRVIDKKLISATESVLESLTLTENKCSELIDDSRSKIFSAFHKKIQDMMKYCQTYKQDLNTRIKSLIQSIQVCEKDICNLAHLLQAHEESPFTATNLTDWITTKETELNVVNTILKQLLDSGAEENNNLDTILSDINVENVVCFTFSSLEQPDELLSDHENYLKHQMMRRDSEKMPDAVSRTWLQGTVREKMREHVKIFKDIMTSHGSQSTKFLVFSKDHTIHPGSCILLYENGSDEAICFNPPSKPACPIIKQVRGHSVDLKVPSPCLVTVELKLMYKRKKEKEWKSQHVHKSQNTLTLTDLSPDTHYEMKYEAVGRLNYTIDSDVIRVTTVNTEEVC